ncbi:MAG: hypothetical protein K0R69_2120 [Clostridia bacterium]|jgi:epoxyqueuosine reductase QueG|nr:hypothetical protein [Clostridia bacterium]
METKIKEMFLALGADACGIAGIEKFENSPKGFHPTDIYKDCKSVIVFIRRLPKGLLHVSSRIVYLNANNMALAELDRIGLAACDALEAMGGTAVPLPCDSPYEYWDSERLEGRGLLSMRHAALSAGLGSMGKNTLIINKTFGNMVNIGALLTDLALESDPPAEDLCRKECQICLKACPSKALSNAAVNQKLCRQHTYTTNGRGFEVCNCNRCRILCPLALGTL